VYSNTKKQYTESKTKTLRNKAVDGTDPTDVSNGIYTGILAQYFNARSRQLLQLRKRFPLASGRSL
jgi:hypothetical protein